MICFNSKIFSDKSQEFDRDFGELYSKLFWPVFGVSMLVLVIIVVLIFYFSRKITKDLTFVTSFFKQLNQNAHRSDMSATASLKVVKPIKNDFKKLFKACEDKQIRVSNLEFEFANFDWMGVRPTDFTLYDNWRKVLYPINRFKNKSLEWNGVIDKLKKIA